VLPTGQAPTPNAPPDPPKPEAPSHPEGAPPEPAAPVLAEEPVDAPAPPAAEASAHAEPAPTLAPSVPEAPAPAPAVAEVVNGMVTEEAAPVIEARDEAHAEEEASTEPADEPEPLIATKARKSEKAEAPEKPAAAPPEPVPEAPPPSNKRWYVVKVQSGREESIRDAIERRVKKEGLEEFYGQIVIPVEKITEVKADKTGKKTTKTKERKLYPGYLMAEVEYNDRILYLFRETSGVGDFVGGLVNRPPPPMSDNEIKKILGGPVGGPASEIPTPPKGLTAGDRVRVTDGAFNGMEGEVKEILEQAGKVRVELTIFGRPVKLELEYYQIEGA
jgi:transcriptional antiterminator NusG